MGRLPKGFAVKKAAAPGSGPQQQSTEDAKLGVEKQQAEAFAAQAKPQSHEPKSKVIKDAHESDDEEGAGLSNLRGRLIQRHKQVSLGAGVIYEQRDWRAPHVCSALTEPWYPGLHAAAAAAAGDADVQESNDTEWEEEQGRWWWWCQLLPC